jgi:cellulose synthase/poly-beta-1,6-N-acetylglucosamine synthase-like glycosyltransferase
MRGEHRTYLLDDAADPACAQLCNQLGVCYLIRNGRAHAKAGNLNAALARTSGDLIAVFDSDHLPQPEFLERTVPLFVDPALGFVQVMVSFSNRNQSWVARAAAETSIDFYNPTSIGMDALRSTTMMGSNAVIRRAALAGIGGYQPGLAEDLATSLALHAAGWRSAYLAEPLAPGLAPATLMAWYTQQLKWARGVFEVLLTRLPKAFARLDWTQRLVYLVRTTKYWVGPIVLLHLALTGWAAFMAEAPARSLAIKYLLCLAPLIASDIWIRREALRRWRHPSVAPIVPLRALLLVYFSWPIYSLAWLMTLLRLPLRFRLTPKTASERTHPVIVLPQLAVSLGLLTGLILGLSGHRGAPEPLLIGALAAQLGPHVGLLVSWAAWPLLRHRELSATELSS